MTTWKGPFPSCYKKPELFSFIVRINTMVNFQNTTSEISHIPSMHFLGPRTSPRVFWDECASFNKAASVTGCKNFLATQVNVCRVRPD